ncbi:MAG TPA: LysR family transcriptional regulator [Mycobacteriales bacterium]|nr:LysR family transcriptional regulator [Mycobacteriales bacterium]
MTTNARLRTFVAVADAGSVRGAAQRLVVTESSVSAAVSALSRDVGVALVEHSGRGLRLTPAGRAYAAYARRILGLHDEALAAARGELDPERGLVRIAAVTTAADHLLPPLLASFRDRYPDVELRLQVANKDDVWDTLTAWAADVVIAGRPPAQWRESVRLVRPNSLVVVGAPGVAGRFRAEPSAAERVSWLLREPGSGTRAACESLLTALDISPPLLTLGSNGAVVAGAAAGLGVTLVSRDAVRTQLAAGELVELAVRGTPLTRPWHAVSQDDMSATTDLLLSHLLATNNGTGQTGWHRPTAAGQPPSGGARAGPGRLRVRARRREGG